MPLPENEIRPGTVAMLDGNNFVQDYFVTLQLHLADVPADRYLAVGQIIRQDFVDLSSSQATVSKNNLHFNRPTRDILGRWS